MYGQMNMMNGDMSGTTECIPITRSTILEGNDTDFRAKYV